MNKKLIIGLSVGAGILLVLAGLGIWVGITQKNINAQRAKDRVAATQVEKLTIGYETESSGFYPNIPFEMVTYEYNAHFYEALTNLNSDFQIESQLAESWENPSDTTWRFRLKKGVQFHDGSIMSAKDVKASLDMAMANENTAGMLPGLTSVEIVDENTVDLITESPSPMLANALTTVYILPEKVITAGDFTNPVGTGPFKYVSSDESGAVNLTRFEGYYGEKAKVANVVLKSYSVPEERLAALKNGEVDVIQSLNDPASVGNDKDGNAIQVATVPGIGTAYLVLDTVSETSPYITGVTTNPFKDIKVRQAMQKALDLDKFIETAEKKTATPAAETVAPTIFGYDPSIAVSTQDLTEAKRLMSEAGYEKGFNVDIDILEPSVARAVTEQLAAIGITVRVNPGTNDTNFFDKVMAGDSAMFFMEYGCGTGDALEAFEVNYGAQPFYGKSYTSPEMTELITKTESNFDIGKRKEDLQQLAKLADAAKANIPLFISKSNFAHRVGLLMNVRFDGFMTAADISGAVPADIQEDLSYVETIKEMLGLNN